MMHNSVFGIAHDAAAGVQVRSGSGVRSFLAFPKIRILRKGQVGSICTNTVQSNQAVAIAEIWIKLDIFWINVTSKINDRMRGQKTARL